MFRFSLDHVQVAIPRGGEALAREFYAGILGLEEVTKPAELASRGGAWFKNGLVQIHLGVEADFVPARKAHPGLVCEQYDALLERLADCGVDVAPDPSPFNGKRHCYIADPFGNRIEIIAGS